MAHTKCGASVRERLLKKAISLESGTMLSLPRYSRPAALVRSMIAMTEDMRVRHWTSWTA
jgi:hypothetical protein